MSISGAVFAQGANNGGGSGSPEEGAYINTHLNTNPQRNARNGFNGTIASNGTGTTATGGIEKGISSTLSTTQMGGQIGGDSSNGQ